MFVLLASSDYDNSVASDDHSTLESAATLIHAFVFVLSRVDYCNAVFAGVPKIITDRLQRVLNAAARVVSDTRKFDRGLSRLMHTELHWLDVPERVQYKLGVLMHQCQHIQAPRYLTDHWTPVSDSFPPANTCVQPAAIKSPFHAASSAHMAVGLFLLLVRRSGTHYLKTCGIRSVLWTVTDSH